MTRKERREQSEYRRCFHCGKYIGFDDFTDGRVVEDFSIEFFGYEKDMFEERVSYAHLTCIKKFEQKKLESQLCSTVRNI